MTRQQDKIRPMSDKAGGASRLDEAHAVAMNAKAGKVPHKLGADQKELAVKAHLHDPNFKQSRDVREDRGERQHKTSPPRAQTR